MQLKAPENFEKENRKPLRSPITPNALLKKYHIQTKNLQNLMIPIELPTNSILPKATPRTSYRTFDK